jgi:hypothetical protein
MNSFLGQLSPTGSMRPWPSRQKKRRRRRRRKKKKCLVGMA